jgi:SAM-dependent methyltransferase
VPGMSEVWEAVWAGAERPTDGLDSPDGAAFDARWRRIRDLLAARHGSLHGVRTIELGAGRGDYSTLLAGLGADVTLLDLNARALQAARGRFRRLGLPAQFVQADLFRLPAATVGAFDAALSFGLLEHFRGARRGRVAAAHAATLRRGGLAFISVPHAVCLPYRLYKAYLEARHWWPYGSEHPVCRWTMRRVARDAGLRPLWTLATSHRKAVFLLAGALGLRRLVRDDWRRASRLDRWVGMDLMLCAEREE